jgi:hypothetical protein
MSEADGSANVLALAIGTAMRNGVRHSLDECWINGLESIQEELACYAAHGADECAVLVG